MPERRAFRLGCRRRFRRAGAAAVEFALIAPVFFLLLAGIMEFGQAFWVKHALANAARRGTRAATVQGATNSQVIAKVKAQCVATMKVKDADITVTISLNGNTTKDVSTAVAGDEINVKVSIPYTKAGVGFYAKTLSNVVLASACTMERE